MCFYLSWGGGEWQIAAFESANNNDCLRCGIVCVCVCVCVCTSLRLAAERSEASADVLVSVFDRFNSAYTHNRK